MGLTVLEKKGEQSKVLCSFCGLESWKDTNNLKRMQSCGCQMRRLIGDAKRVHGEAYGRTKKGSKEYKAWCSMRRRCLTPTSTDYPDYGGRGITICERWQDSFESFLADVGRAPTPRHSIDRKDVNGNYEPGNVRWLSAKGQANNRRTSLDLTINGQTKAMDEWAADYGIAVNTIRNRLHMGWTLEKAVTTPRKWAGRNGSSK